MSFLNCEVRRSRALLYTQRSLRIIHDASASLSNDRITKLSNKTIFLLVICLSSVQFSTAQNLNPRPGERIQVKGGIAEVSAENRARVNLGAMTPDSLYRFMAAMDSLRADGIRFDRAGTDSIVTALIDRTPPAGDTLDQQGMAELLTRRKALTLNSATVRRFMDDPAFIGRYIDGGADTLIPRIARLDTLSKREKRRQARLDPNAYRHSPIFRDSIRLSRMTMYSIPVPGFSQLYNKQYWKIPVLYGTVAAGVGVYAWQTKLYKPYKRQYDRFVGYKNSLEAAGGPTYDRYKTTMVELQSNMIRHNTYRQLAIGFAAMSYMYFLVDGALNYAGTATDVKKATTLATVFPGAGQIYNGSYWKLPIVLGGVGILTYVVNWNNRGYQRFLLAYNQRTDGDDNTVDEFDGTGYNLQPNDLLQYKNSYRRNRDLSMIFLGLFYVLQLVDAHATAHMKTYDVSDDLTRVDVTFEPSVERLYTHRMGGGGVNTYGFSLNIRF